MIISSSVNMPRSTEAINLKRALLRKKIYKKDTLPFLLQFYPETDVIFLEKRERERKYIFVCVSGFPSVDNDSTEKTRCCFVCACRVCGCKHPRQKITFEEEFFLSLSSSPFFISLTSGKSESVSTKKKTVTKKRYKRTCNDDDGVFGWYDHENGRDFFGDGKTSS